MRYGREYIARVGRPIVTKRDFSNMHYLLRPKLAENVQRMADEAKEDWRIERDIKAGGTQQPILEQIRLDKLDKDSLVHQRKLTIPFVKKMLKL